MRPPVNLHGATRAFCGLALLIAANIRDPTRVVLGFEPLSAEPENYTSLYCRGVLFRIGPVGSPTRSSGDNYVLTAQVSKQPKKEEHLSWTT